jgi:O-antigen/teichoic acid export membrane protein
LKSIIDHWLTRARRARELFRLRAFETDSAAGRSAERYRRIILTIGTGLAARTLGSLVGLITVPLTLGYLGAIKYGFWALLSTAVSWFSLLGFNITGGLRNALAEASGRDDRNAAATYLRTAFITLSVIAATALLLLLVVSKYIDWGHVLGASRDIASNTANNATLAAFTLFLVGLPAAVAPAGLAAFQKQYLSDIVTVAALLFTVPLLILAIHLNASLVVLLVVLGSSGIVNSIGSHLILRFRAEPWLRSMAPRFSWRALRRIGAISTPMFFYQIGSLLVNETQQIVIARKANLFMVTQYAILMRVTILSYSIIALGTSAFLPAFREARERGDHVWLKHAFRRMLGGRMLLATMAVAIMMFAGNAILRFWLRRSDMTFEIRIWAVMGAGLLSAVWVTSHTDYMSSFDDIWRQVGLVLLNGIVTTILCVVLVDRYGLIGIICATYSVTILLWTWIVPLLARSKLRLPSEALPPAEPNTK